MNRRIITASSTAVLAAGLVLGTVAAAQSTAWQAPATSHEWSVTDHNPDALADLADEAAQVKGTDAGLITEPAGDPLEDAAEAQP